MSLLGCSEADWDKVREAARREGRVSLKNDPTLAKVAAKVMAEAGFCCVKARILETSKDVATMYCLRAWRLLPSQLNTLYEQIMK